jgi:uncharacterized membrane protein
MLTASPRSAWIVIAWSLGLIASLAGWGSLVARFLDEEEPSRWGLRLGWGTAAVLLLGGPLLALHLAFGKVLTVMVGVGWALLALDLWRRRAGFRAALGATVRGVVENPATAIVALLVFGAAALVLAASAFEPTSTFRTDDDTVAYLAFPREIFMTGGSVQPFSLRHAYALNGQSFLQALLLPRLHVEELFVMDRGIFLVIALILVIGLSERPLLQRAPYALLPALVLVLLPNTRVNIASMLTGTVALLTLYSAMLRHKRGGSLRQAVGVGLAAFMAITLRPAYGPPVALALLAGYVPPLWKDRARWRTPLSEALVVGATTIACLVPWMIVAYRSDATPMFPLMQGTIRKLAMGGRGGFFFVPRIVWSALMVDDAFRAPLVLALGGLCLQDPGERPILRAWVLSPFLALAALLFFDPRTIQVNALRYTLPVVLAAVLVVGARAMTILEELGPGSAKRDVVGAAIAVFGLLLHLHVAREATSREFADAVNTLRKLEDSPPVLGAQSASYRELQFRTDPGSTILSMTMRPYLFDFSYNRVVLLDYPGLAGPRPGFPVDGTDDAYVKYLRDNGIRYLAISNERPDPYDLGIWRPRAKDVKSRTDPESWDQAAWAPVFVGVVEAMERLSAHYTVVFRDPTLALFDLTKPR